MGSPVNDLRAEFELAAVKHKLDFKPLRRDANDRSDLGALDYLVIGKPCPPGAAILFRNPVDTKKLSPPKQAICTRFANQGWRVIICTSVDELLVQLGVIRPTVIKLRSRWVAR